MLGSIASGNYVDVLLQNFGDQLCFPADFVGRGDMSRGGLMLWCAQDRQELRYIPVAGAIRNGKRPPKLPARRYPKIPTRMRPQKSLSGKPSHHLIDDWKLLLEMAFAITPPLPPMEAHSVDEIPVGKNWQYEPKWDGFRCIVFPDRTHTYLQSKKGLPWMLSSQ